MNPISIKKAAWLFAGLSLGVTDLLAQTRPDAGSLLPPPQNATPREGERNLVVKPATPSTPASNESASRQGEIFVKQFRFEGELSGLPESLLQEKLASLTNKAQSLSNLQAAVGKLEAGLRSEQGLILAKAWIPIQEVRDGTVSINIAVGLFGTTRLPNALENTPRGDALRAIAQAYLQGGKPLQQKSLEELAYRAADYVGRPVQVVLVPAAQFGHYDVRLDPMTAGRYTGSLSLDNTGNRYTSEWHDNLRLVVDDISGHSDQLELSGQLLTARQRALKIRYQHPFATGWRIGAEAQNTDYSLCCTFSTLQAKGDSRMMGLDASYNIVRTRAFSAFAGIALQQRKLNNDQFGSSISQRTLDAATLKGSLLWSGLADHAMTLGLTLGHADLADNRGDLLADSRTAQLAGGYQKLSLGYQQYRPLTAHTQFRLNINGQLSDKNLDPSEKLSLGGLTGVRAYPYGEAMGDQGGIAQAELVYSPSNDWQLIGFVDYGRIRRNRNAWPGMAAANGYALKGYGIGALWRPTRQFSLHAIAAAPFGNNPGAAVITHADSDGRNPGARLWLVGTWAF